MCTCCDIVCIYTMIFHMFFFFFFFNDTATTEIYTLSLHDALPICEADALDAFVGLHPYQDLARPGDGEMAHPVRAPGIGGAQDVSLQLGDLHRWISFPSDSIVALRGFAR